MNREEGRKGGVFQVFRLGVADSPGLHMVAASAGEVVVTPSYLASLSPPPFSLLSLSPPPFYPLYHPPLPLVFCISLPSAPSSSSFPRWQLVSSEFLQKLSNRGDRWSGGFCNVYWIQYLKHKLMGALKANCVLTFSSIQKLLRTII